MKQSLGEHLLLLCPPLPVALPALMVVMVEVAVAVAVAVAVEEAAEAAPLPQRRRWRHHC
jgi:hypothetical protein